MSMTPAVSSPVKFVPARRTTLVLDASEFKEDFAASTSALAKQAAGGMNPAKTQAGRLLNCFLDALDDDQYFAQFNERIKVHVEQALNGTAFSSADEHTRNEALKNLLPAIAHEMLASQAFREGTAFSAPGAISMPAASEPDKTYRFDSFSLVTDTFFVAETTLNLVDVVQVAVALEEVVLAFVYAVAVAAVVAEGAQAKRSWNSYVSANNLMMLARHISDSRICHTSVVTH